MQPSRNHRSFSLFLALLFTLSAGAQGLGMFVGGIQVNESDHEIWMKALGRVGLNTVAVTVYAQQGDWDSDNLSFEHEKPGVLAEIRAARRHDKEVVLILRVALDDTLERNEFLWHGMIQPRTDEQLDSWFGRYRRFVLRWARIAEREGVSMLGVGSELNSLASTRLVEEIPPLAAWYLDEEKQALDRVRILAYESELEDRDWAQGAEGYASLPVYLDSKKRVFAAWARQVAHLDSENPVAEINRRRRLLERHWLGVIETVRKAYRGPLTFAANFDQYSEITFWSELDVLGVNAYFPLRTAEIPDDLYSTLRVGWSEVIGNLLAFREDEGLGTQPVVFTELGYTWRRDSTVEPWNGFGFSVLGKEDAATRLVVWGEEDKNLEERATAVRALHDELAARNAHWFHGMLWWKLSTIGSHRDIEPFVLWIGPESEDPLMGQLRRFLYPWWKAGAEAVSRN